MRYAADIATTRNGQQSTAGALVGRWKHEIQVAILRRRAAMARAVLPRATAQELWLLAGQVDRDGEDARGLLPLEEDGDFDDLEDDGETGHEMDDGEASLHEGGDADATEEADAAENTDPQRRG